MCVKDFPVIDPVATGNNIRRLRIERGMTIRELQDYFGFKDPVLYINGRRVNVCPQ